METLISYKDIQYSSLCFLSSLFKKFTYSHSPSCNKKPSIHVPMSTVTPAFTTTQVLSPNTKSCILPQRIIDLSMILQNNSKNQVVSSNGIGPLRPKTSNDVIKDVKPPAAEQPKNPIWKESHSYRRSTRVNGNNLRIYSAELNMIHALKITRPLKPRRSYSPRRSDEFIWGRPSLLRNIITL